MADIIRKRLTGKEEGFTLIELLVVIVILGILMAIAVPSYMGFADRANKTAAQANIRSAVPAVEAYYQGDPSSGNQGGTYVGMDLAGLQAIDSSIKLTALVPAKQTDTSFCISDLVGGWYASQTGPSGGVTVTKTSTDPCA